MPLLFKGFNQAAGPLASTAKFSARHPIHVILTVLLLSTFAYLSVIQYYLSGFRSGFDSITQAPLLSRSIPDVAATTLTTRSVPVAGFTSKESVFQDSTHYYRASSKSDWEILPLNEARKQLENSKHYYLYNINFSTKKDDSLLPDIKEGNVLHETKNGKYILSSSIINKPELISKDGTRWHLLKYSTRLFDIQKFISKLYRLGAFHIHQSEPFDIFIIFTAYLTMFYTFIKLFNDLRRKGSNFWLSLSTIVNSGCSLFLALYTTQCLFGKTVSAISVLEGVPFIVVIIGFKHQVRLALSSLEKLEKTGISRNMTPDRIVYESMLEEGGAFVQDNLFCFVAFVGCSIYASNLTMLANFCIFCACLLTYEVILTSTFYSAVISLKLEINVIYRSTLIKQTLEEDGVIPSTAEVISQAKENVNENSIFQSTTMVLTAKLALISLFILVHFFNFGVQWTSDTFFSIYFKTVSKGDLPEFVKNSEMPSRLFFDEPILISMVPTQYYQPAMGYYRIQDVFILVFHYLSVAIRDRLISKVVFMALIVSASINIYLLNAARIHTFYTVDDLVRKKSVTSLNSLTTESNVRDSKSRKIGKFDSPFGQLLGKTELSEKSKKKKSKQKKSKRTSSLLSNIDSIDRKSEVDSQVHVTAEEVDLSDESIEERPLEELVELLKNGEVKSLHNKEITTLVTNSKLPLYALEKQLGDTTRAVLIRRNALAILANSPVLATDRLPYEHYDYDRVFGACCENVIGYMPLPVGVIGPLIIDGVPYHIPMATTEGCLVASAMRGCKAINSGGGAITVLTKDGMTRGPCVRFPSLRRSGACKIWLDSEEGQNKIKKAFNSTSRFARLQHIQTALAGDLLFVRFRTTTGDAMGMNMISKGVEFSLKQMVEEFGWDDMEVVSVSGNYCTDKKPAAINWIEGRGKSVVAEATIPGDIVRKVLKSDVSSLVELNISKNLIGSAMAGSVGGFNAHAANLLTAVFLALGQDPAQNVESSNCITLMKEVDGDLRISVSMPCIEVGTIGGGTVLEPQGAMLDLLGVRGPHPTNPGENARQLAKIVACAVMAGELSLCSALAAGHLVQSHMTHNRAQAPKPAVTTPATESENIGSINKLTDADVKRLKEGSVTCIKS